MSTCSQCLAQIGFHISSAAQLILCRAFLSVQTRFSTMPKSLGLYKVQRFCYLLRFQIDLAHLWTDFQSCFSFYRTQVYLESDLWVRVSVTEWGRFLKLNWVDSGWWNTNSILTDNANRAIQVNVAMHVDATWWPKLQLMHVAPPGG